MGKHDSKKPKAKKAAKGKGGKHLPEKIEKAPKVVKTKKGKLTVATAKAVIDDPTSGKKAVREAERFLADERAATKNAVAAQKAKGLAKASDRPGANESVTTEEQNKIDARIKAERLIRKAFPKHAPAPEEVDLTNHELVSAYNLVHGVDSGHYLTSTEEVEKAVASISAEAPMPTVKVGKAKGKKAAQEATSAPEIDEPPAQVAEEVETENGREFVTGVAHEPGAEVDDRITAAVEPEPGIERDHLGRPKIEYVNEKGETKTKAYTRVTTYIDCLEDKTQLDKWKTRTLLEGAGLDLDEYRTDAERDLADSLVGQAREAARIYEAALAKIDKDQRKGKLDLGQYGLRRKEAKKVHDDTLNELATKALDLGGVHERAQKGTDLHAWTERYDKSGLSIVDFLALEQPDEVTAADLMAYADTMTRLGIEHVAMEHFVVLDHLGIAGTLDRASMFKFPGSGRRIRCVADIKTGRIDYSAGKIGMQLRAYAEGEAYDPAKPLAERRTPLKLSKTQGLLIHLPQGEARCEVYVVDLALASKGLGLARQVREWRNEGKRTYSVGTPLTAEDVAN